MKVSDQGVVSLDIERMTEDERRAVHHDPGYREAVQSWQDRINNAVQDMMDADAGVRIALQAVVVDESLIAGGRLQRRGRERHREVRGPGRRRGAGEARRGRPPLGQGDRRAEADVPGQRRRPGVLPDPPRRPGRHRHDQAHDRAERPHPRAGRRPRPRLLRDRDRPGQRPLLGDQGHVVAVVRGLARSGRRVPQLSISATARSVAPRARSASPERSSPETSSQSRPGRDGQKAGHPVRGDGGAPRAHGDGPVGVRPEGAAARSRMSS